MPRLVCVLLLGAVCLVSVRQSSGLPQMNGDGLPVVNVDQGRIIGNNETQVGVNILTFKGIPFAVPPVDELRFKAPIAAGPFSGDLIASKHPHSCNQPWSVTSREDCLYLNVFTPESALDVNKTEDPLAVMVWIHGGAFFSGSISGYDNVYPMISRNVIVVTIQYRLGILGFLSTDDDAAAGNYGLMDITLALQWVNDNIADFGGDVNRITLFGESAGAAAVSHQILAPSASGLFRNAIMMSGNALQPWGMGREYYETSRDLAEMFNCSTATSAEIVSCLKGVGAQLLANTYPLFWDWNTQPYKFGPRVDGVYLPEEPAILLKEGRYSQVPVITGICRNEMGFEVGEMYLTGRPINLLVDDFESNGQTSLELLDEEDPLNTATLVYEYYTGGLNFTKEASPRVNKMYTDAIFAIRHDWYVQTVGDTIPIYTYSLDQDGPGSVMDGYYAAGLDLPQGEEWISHGDDVKYIFGSPGLEEDAVYKTLQTHFANLYTNFAKFGTPTPDDSTLGFQWPIALRSAMDHLSVTLSPEMVADDRSADRQFWETLPTKVNLLLHNSASLMDLSFTLIIFSIYFLYSNYVL